LLSLLLSLLNKPENLKLEGDDDVDGSEPELAERWIISMGIGRPFDFLASGIARGGDAA